MCSSSSPGLSGCCSPFAKTYGLYFSDKKEPETQEYELANDIEKQCKKKTKYMVGISNDCGSDTYYERLYKLYETLKEFNGSMVKRIEEFQDVIPPNGNEVDFDASKLSITDSEEENRFTVSIGDNKQSVDE